MKNREKNFISAVVYVHNAGNQIGEFLDGLIGTLEDNFEDSEIICVNDSSGDDSVEQIRNASHEAIHTCISILNMSYFHGMEMAMNAGRDLAIGDFVFEFDDIYMEYGANEIMSIYRRALEGYDVVSAAPDMGQRFSSHMFYRVFDWFTDLAYQMRTESFRILSRRVINRVSSMNRAVPYRKAVYANCGLRTDRIMYQSTVHNRKLDGTERRYRSRLAVDSLIMFTDIGYRLSIAMTFFMMTIAAFMMLYSIGVYLTSSPVAGWTTTILFLSVVFFGLFGVLTVIVKYLQLLLELTFKRKQYSFESIEKLAK